MPDIIRLLPDNVANQIAAGEVVQRPASAVKELLENSIDAGSTTIKLVVKDAGKSLIQIIDDGKGMSETDARMAFERHATSKIESAEDIFSIKTKGFRGEALASIAAVAQVDLKTRTHDEDLGSHIKIEGSKIVKQEFCQCPPGTQIEVKNLFFNIPARRNFLKSQNVELRHIIDEFERVALAHPEISFSLYHNDGELFELPGAKIRQRIVNVFGPKFNEKLVPVNETTPILKLTGFIGKPEFAKKTRGEQFFFANNRFIKNNYLHKAVCNAFEGLVNPDSHPTYFLFLELDPARIDVNIHPTKTEIKFEDEKSVFTIIRTAVKHALGQYNIAPSLDFEVDNQFAVQRNPNDAMPEAPGITIDPTYNPFESTKAKTAGNGNSSSTFTKQQHAVPKPTSAESEAWLSMLQDIPEMPEEPQQQKLEIDGALPAVKTFLQVGKKYIFTNHGEGLIMVHMQRAHERILYEKVLQNINNHNIPSQQLLFPQNITFASADFEIVKDLLADLRLTGFDVDEFGKNEIIVNGIPLYLDASNVEAVLQGFLEDEKNHKSFSKGEPWEKVASTLARFSAMRTGTKMSQPEMSHMIDELFACSSPYVNPEGKPTLANLNMSDIDKSFN